MDLNEKTKVLIEALPYIKKYKGKIVVIKFGGNALSEIKSVIGDVILLSHIGIRPIIVHGGGPEIDKELEKLKIKPKFVNGLRYTDEITIEVVGRVFRKINRNILSYIKSHGAKASGLKGCIKAEQKSKEWGLVGEIAGVRKNMILNRINSGSIVVISPMGIGKNRVKYNINADTVASSIAVAIGAEKLTILTNVDGVRINGKLLTHIDFDTAKEGIKNGNISKGMIPKVEACIYAVKNKCPKAHLINGLVPHSLLLEIFTDKGIGTEIVYKNGNK
jgi:acetylglutamate kinase